jgi:hypothetical protein
MMAHIWTGGLILFAISCALCAGKLWQTPPAKSEEKKVSRGKETSQAPAASWGQKILWLLLPACASTLLLATTNMICQEVAVIAFLWVLPLALYLLSFIICFDSPRWYMRLPFAIALVAALGSICWVVFQGTEVSLLFQLSVYLSGLFICCMVCHGELYRLRPDPSHLTGYYLMIAAGGALGGLFVAIVAPLIFNGYYELHWGLFLCGLLFLIVCLRAPKPADPKSNSKFFIPAQKHQTAGHIILATGLTALGIALWINAHPAAKITPVSSMDDTPGRSHTHAKVMVERSRNFYGTLTVNQHDITDWNTQLMELVHGRTLHGLQFTDPQRAADPTLYYTENSGAGVAMQALPTGSHRIGLIGLGVGTLAAYARAGDYVHVYEINPDVVRLAHSRFTYLSRCAGTVEVTPGDARLSLEKEPAQAYDLLVLDAFNSDAIPVHLLTKEAFMTYRRHLKTNGIIAIHVTNQSLNLEPVVANLAHYFNYQIVTIDDVPPADEWWIAPSTWMLLSENEQFINSPEIALAKRPQQTDSVQVPLWTDDFASLFQIFRAGQGTVVDAPFAEKSAEEQSRIASNLIQQGDFSGAVDCYQVALKRHPDMPDMLNNFAWLLATCPDPKVRDGAQAVKHAQRACDLTNYRVPTTIGTLAAAYAEAGRFDEAATAAQKAIALATDSGQKELARRNEALLKLYRANQPFHETTTSQ